MELFIDDLLLFFLGAFSLVVYIQLHAVIITFLLDLSIL